jgi:dephospho-CoA kinase
MTTKKFKIAVTGGIGSGKSEFCGFLKSNGFPIIYADDIAKDVLVNNKKVKDKIITAFGHKSYNNSKPDTKYLSEVVFADPEKVNLINSIIHPHVIKIQNRLMDEFLKENWVVFLEAALIYEAEIDDLFDYVVLITSDENNKVERTQKRSKLSVEEIKKRIENQIPDDIKREWADFVFENNGSLIELKNKSELFINILKTIRGEH